MTLEFRPLCPTHPIERLLAYYMSTFKQLWSVRCDGCFFRNGAYEHIMELEVRSQVYLTWQLLLRGLDNLSNFCKFWNCVCPSFYCFEERWLQAQLVYFAKLFHEIPTKIVSMGLVEETIVASCPLICSLIYCKFFYECETAHYLHDFFLVGNFCSYIIRLPNEGPKVFSRICAAFLACLLKVLGCWIWNFITTELCRLSLIFFFVLHLLVIKRWVVNMLNLFLRLLIKDCFPDLNCVCKHLCAFRLLNAELKVFQHSNMILLTESFLLTLVHLLTVL